jgi:hypothetical protein
MTSLSELRERAARVCGIVSAVGGGWFLLPHLGGLG